MIKKWGLGGAVWLLMAYVLSALGSFPCWFVSVPGLFYEGRPFNVPQNVPRLELVSLVALMTLSLSRWSPIKQYLASRSRLAKTASLLWAGVLVLGGVRVVKIAVEYSKGCCLLWQTVNAWQYRSGLGWCYSGPEFFDLAILSRQGQQAFWGIATLIACCLIVSPVFRRGSCIARSDTPLAQRSVACLLAALIPVLVGSGLDLCGFEGRLVHSMPTIPAKEGFTEWGAVLGFASILAVLFGRKQISKVLDSFGTAVGTLVVLMVCAFLAFVGMDTCFWIPSGLATYQLLRNPIPKIDIDTDMGWSHDDPGSPWLYASLGASGGYLSISSDRFATPAEFSILLQKGLSLAERLQSSDADRKRLRCSLSILFRAEEGLPISKVDEYVAAAAREGVSVVEFEVGLDRSVRFGPWGLLRTSGIGIRKKSFDISAGCPCEVVLRPDVSLGTWLNGSGDKSASRGCCWNALGPKTP